MPILSGSRIRHSVAFALRHEPGSAQAESFLAALQALAGIDGVEELEVVREVSAKNSYQLGVVMEFRSQEAYDAYTAHPDHVAFVATRWDAEVTDFIEIDFVGLGAG